MLDRLRILWRATPRSRIATWSSMGPPRAARWNFFRWREGVQGIAPAGTLNRLAIRGAIVSHRRHALRRRDNGDARGDGAARGARNRRQLETVSACKWIVAMLNSTSKVLFNAADLRRAYAAEIARAARRCAATRSPSTPCARASSSRPPDCKSSNCRRCFCRSLGRPRRISSPINSKRRCRSMKAPLDLKDHRLMHLPRARRSRQNHHQRGARVVRRDGGTLG